MIFYCGICQHESDLALSDARVGRHSQTCPKCDEVGWGSITRLEPDEADYIAQFLENFAVDLRNEWSHLKGAVFFGYRGDADLTTDLLDLLVLVMDKVVLDVDALTFDRPDHPLISRIDTYVDHEFVHLVAFRPRLDSIRSEKHAHPLVARALSTAAVEAKHFLDPFPLDLSFLDLARELGRIGLHDIIAEFGFDGARKAVEHERLDAGGNSWNGPSNARLRISALLT